MSVQKRVRSGKTRWVARYRDASGREHSKTFDTKREATAWTEERKREMRRGEWISPEDRSVTLGELVKEWHAAATRPNTKANRKALMDNLGPLREMPVIAIRTSHISEWRALMLTKQPWNTRGRGYSESTVSNMVGQIAGLLKTAHKDGLIARVPRIEGAKSAPETSVRRGDILTPENIAAMIDATGTKKFNSPPRPWLGRMIIVAAGSGLRVSEIGGLRPMDVNFLGKEIYVRQQTGVDNKPAKLKSDSAARTIPAPAIVTETIAEQLAETPRGMGETIWERDRGGMHGRASIGGALRRLVELHGLREATMHDFRHFYASSLIAAGVPVTGVQAALGHARPATTLNTYAHLFEGAEDVTRTAAEQVMTLVRDQCGTSGNVVPLRAAK